MTNTAITRADAADIMERVITSGDLAKLTPADRVQYYGRVCESVGLNPLTRPFEYINLNGKLTLYARKDATDQLRKLYNVSLTISSRDRLEDVYIVTARATLPDGRTDESTGVVSIGNLKADNLANALMKAETKAKRRVTLSICGLGWLDETETPTIADARPVNVDVQTGEINPQPRMEVVQPQALPEPDPAVSEAESAFWQRYGKVLGYTQWSAVQALLETKRQKPATVEGWERAAGAVDAALSRELQAA